jgi:hypothetical protein
VDFAPTGVTVIEGPNEIGKSSLFEALDLLFDELDSSGKTRVRAVKPVHTDAGAEVEADVETGPYAFTYSKRFHRRAQTTLTVRAPHGESVTGREAHERAEAILRDTLDVDLWKALRVAQGDGLEQAEISDKRWLTAALDRAAGGVTVTSGREEALFDRVCVERDRWWSERGPRKEITETEDRSTAADAVVSILKAEIGRFEEDVDRVASLSKEATRLDGSFVELERRAAERRAEATGVATLRAARDDAEMRLAQAETVRARAQAVRDARMKLAEDLSAAEAEALEVSRAIEIASPALTAVRAALAEAETVLAAADALAGANRRDADLRERDFEYRREALDLEQLEERSNRLEVADREADAAEATVASVVVDDKMLAKLRRLYEEVVKARVRLEAASAVVHVEALGACAPMVGDIATPLAPGETREFRVDGVWKLEVPGVLRIDVRSGVATDAPRAEFDACRRAFDDALVEAHVVTLDEAVATNAALRDAQRVLTDRDRVAKENLRDLTREGLRGKIDALRPRVAGYLVQRIAEPLLAENFDAAKELRRLAREDSETAGAAVAVARTRRDEAKLRADAATRQAGEIEVRARLLHDRAAEMQGLLDAHRTEASDDVLEQALTDANSVSRAISTEANAASVAFSSAQPDLVESLVESSRNAADQARTEHHRVERELETLRATLALRGEDGLSEKLGAAESALEATRGEAARKHAQAAAAKVLFEAMSGERDAERARYVAPFKAKVESLGRTVFGPDFAVQVTDDLSIATRTLGGRTVDFESLSGGAKEQIGVISRIACALLASEQGGVPVVLDDAFGWSDPDRLERMGALLTVAGRSCQVILLTCDPARHRHILGARVVRIE